MQRLLTSGARNFRTVLFFLSTLAWAPLLAAQSLQTGIPPFATVDSGPDHISLADFNLHFAFPVFGRTGRMPFSFATYRENTGWTNPFNGSSYQWSPIFGLMYSPIGDAIYTTGTATCRDGYGQSQTYNKWTFSTFQDPQGNSHAITVNLKTSHVPTPRGTCPASTDTESGSAHDGSGVTLTASAGSALNSVVATMRDGSVIIPPVVNCTPICGSPSPLSGVTPSWTDSNGNRITYYWNSTTHTPSSITDTLGTTAVTYSINGAASSTATYTSPSGQSASVVQTNKQYTIETAFGCSGIAEYPATSWYMPDRITYPDASYYQFTYETLSNGHITGRITSVRLPTGATISYQYTGINCKDGSVATMIRTTPDGTWRYNRLLNLDSGGNILYYTNTITDPQSNQTVINFSYSGYETQRKVYQGSVSANTCSATVTTNCLLSVTITCYNGQTLANNCPTQQFAGPGTEATTYTSLNGGPNAEVDTLINGTGLPTEKDEYDFGATIPTRKTSTTYAAIGNGVQDRPSVVIVTDGSGNRLSETDFTYDEDVNSLQPSGASQLFPPTCSSGTCRGNLTTQKSCISYASGTCSAYLTKTYTHYDTGQPFQSYDINGAQTAYTYGACGNSLLTTVNLPLGLSRSYSWNCTGGVMTSTTDENSQISYTNYTTDHFFWRPESTKDRLGNLTTLTYPSLTRTEASLPIIGSAYVDVVKTLDTLGRPSLTQKRQAPPSGTTLDTAYQTYDSLGRPLHSYMPCATTLGVVCTTPSSTTTYDGAGRAIKVQDGSTATVQTITYNQNDTYVDVSAPSGENDKRKQLQYDGLGRLTSVCEITNNSGDTYWGTCAQTNPQSGYWTQYAYNLPYGTPSSYNSLTATQNAQKGTAQTRTYIYDMLGRLIQETNPETKTTNYTYDSDASGVCPGTYPGDLVNKTDASSQTTCYTYDALHRRLSITFAGNNSANTDSKYFVYDAATVNGTTMQFASGRLAEAYTCPPTGCGTNNSAIKTDLGFSYSGRGEVLTTYEKTPHSPNYYTTAASYWAHGALNQLSSNLTGVPTVYYGASDGSGLDGEGRVTRVTASSGQNPATSVIYTTSGTSQPIGTLASVTYGSADHDNFTYDVNTGRLTKYVFNVGTTPQTVTGNLDWSANGSLASLGIIDQLSSQNTQSCTFGYDDLGRSSSASCGTAWSQTFSFDPFGNVSKSGSSSFLPTYSQSTNRYTAIPGCSTFSYNQNGYLTNDCSHSYVVNSSGRLNKIDTIILTYDALGRMVEENNSGAYTEIVYAPSGSKLALMNGATLKSAFVPLTGGGTAVYGPSGLAYYRHGDWLGSSRLATNPTQSSQPSYYFDTAYAPYGEYYANAGTTDLNFTGKNQDTAAGLYDFSNREYNYIQGRWAAPDPAGSAAVNLANPQTWNRYAYVAGNPLASTDPSGLFGAEGIACRNNWNAHSGVCAQRPPAPLNGTNLDLLTGPPVVERQWIQPYAYWRSGWNSDPNAKGQRGDLVTTRGHWGDVAVGSLTVVADEHPGLKAFYNNADCPTCGRTLRSAIGTMNDWRTYAAWYGASILVGGGGAIIANTSTMHVAIGELEGNIHFAFESEGTWMHGLLVPGTDEVVATEGLAESFAEGATQLPVPVLHPEAVLPEVGTSMTNCFTGMCSAILRGWGF